MKPSDNMLNFYNIPLELREMVIEKLPSARLYDFVNDGPNKELTKFARVSLFKHSDKGALKYQKKLIDSWFRTKLRTGKLSFITDEDDRHQWSRLLFPLMTGSDLEIQEKLRIVVLANMISNQSGVSTQRLIKTIVKEGVTEIFESFTGNLLKALLPIMETGSVESLISELIAKLRDDDDVVRSSALQYLSLIFEVKINLDPSKCSERILVILANNRETSSFLHACNLLVALAPRINTSEAERLTTCLINLVSDQDWDEPPEEHLKAGWAAFNALVMRCSGSYINESIRELNLRYSHTFMWGQQSRSIFVRDYFLLLCSFARKCSEPEINNIIETMLKSENMAESSHYLWRLFPYVNKTQNEKITEILLNKLKHSYGTDSFAKIFRNNSAHIQEKYIEILLNEFESKINIPMPDNGLDAYMQTILRFSKKVSATRLSKLVDLLLMKNNSDGYLIQISKLSNERDLNRISLVLSQRFNEDPWRLITLLQSLPLREYAQNCSPEQAQAMLNVIVTRSTSNVSLVRYFSLSYSKMIIDLLQDADIPKYLEIVLKALSDEDRSCRNLACELLQEIAPRLTPNQSLIVSKELAKHIQTGITTIFYLMKTLFVYSQYFDSTVVSQIIPFVPGLLASPTQSFRTDCIHLLMALAPVCTADQLESITNCIIQQLNHGNPASRADACKYISRIEFTSKESEVCRVFGLLKSKLYHDNKIVRTVACESLIHLLPRLNQEHVNQLINPGEVESLEKATLNFFAKSYSMINQPCKPSSTLSLF